MAMGIFPGAGGVKEAKEIYIGHSGVTTVKEVYIGQGGSVKKVWPAYTDYGGSTVDMLSSSLIDDYFKYDTVGDSLHSSGTISSSYAYTGFNSSYHCVGNSDESSAITSGARDCCHGFQTITNLDTRGYDYICARFMIYRYSGSTTSGRAKPFIFYGSGWNDDTGWSDRLTQYSSYLSVNTRSSRDDIENYGFYVLFDISKMQQESTSVCFGCKIWVNADSTVNGCLLMDDVTLCQSIPSKDIALTLTWG